MSLGATARVNAIVSNKELVGAINTSNLNLKSPTENSACRRHWKRHSWIHEMSQYGQHHS
eukprot:1523627-Prorocentrum_lima.AAC.1